MLNYQQVQSNNDEDVVGGDGQIVWPILAVPFVPASVDEPIDVTAPERNLAREARARFKFDYKAANLEFGQSINADSLVWLRLFEGLQFAQTDDFHVKYKDPFTRVDIDGVSTEFRFPDEDVVQESKFNGVGPRIGLDLAFPFGSFALTSEIAGGFLVGKVTSKFRDTIETIPTTTELGTGIDSEKIVSPFWDMKVALSYTTNLFSQTKWTVDLGYMATHYFNAATSFRHVTNLADVYVKQVDDLTFEGPYLMLTVYGLGACPPDCPHPPFCVIVPELKGGIEAAVEILYLQAHVTNLDYATVGSKSSPRTSRRGCTRPRAKPKC